MLNSERNQKSGKFQKSSWRWFPKLVISFIVISGIAGAILARQDAMKENVVIAKKMVTSVAIATPVLAERKPDRLDKYVESKKENLMEWLRKCEGNGIPDDGRPTFDPPKIDGKIIPKCLKIGGQMDDICLSHGSLQMKVPTMQEWNRQLTGKNLSYKEATDIAYDKEKAAEFAYNVIINIKGSINRWSCYSVVATNSEREKITMDVNIIRDLQ